MQNPNVDMTNSDQSLQSGGATIDPKTGPLSADDDGQLDVGSQDDVAKVHSGSSNGSKVQGTNEPPLNPEQPTPDKEFQTVINSAMGKTNVEKAKVDDSPEEEAPQSLASDSKLKDTESVEAAKEMPESKEKSGNEENEAPVVNILENSETGSP